MPGQAAPRTERCVWRPGCCSGCKNNPPRRKPEAAPAPARRQDTGPGYDNGPDIGHTLSRGCGCPVRPDRQGRSACSFSSLLLFKVTVHRHYPQPLPRFVCPEEGHQEKRLPVRAAAGLYFFALALSRRLRWRSWLRVRVFFLPSNGLTDSWNSTRIGVPMIFNDLRK